MHFMQLSCSSVVHTVLSIHEAVYLTGSLDRGKKLNERSMRKLHQLYGVLYVLYVCTYILTILR